MALQQVNFGSASDGSQGDTARAAFGKINANFSDTTNAASRLVGTAAGQVMEVGAFGLGQTLATANSADLNTYQIAGQRIFTSSSAANAPVADFGYLEVNGVGDAANRVAQTWTHYNANRRFTRVLAGSGWTAWRENVVVGSSPTFGGYLTVSRTDAFDTGVDLQGPAGKPRYLAYRTGTLPRFFFGADGSAEGGNNGGSNFFIDRYNDSGSYLGRPVQINRATGLMTLESVASSGPIRPGQYTLASLPSASAFTGYEIDVTDAAGGAKRCRSDGTNWKIINTTTTVS